MKLSIIIPVYNEAETIQAVVESVAFVFLDGVEKEVIVVDDGSETSLRFKVESLKLKCPEIKFIRHDRNLGKGAAIKNALRVVSGDYVLIQDADLEYNPSDYPLLLSPILSGEARVVFGSRFLGKNRRNYFYALGNILATKIFNMFFGVHLTDIATCYKVFPSEIKDKLLRMEANDFVFDVVQLTYTVRSAGFRIKEVPISYKPRRYRDKKLRIRHGIMIFLEIFRLGFNHVRQHIF